MSRFSLEVRGLIALAVILFPGVCLLTGLSLFKDAKWFTNKVRNIYMLICLGLLIFCNCILFIYILPQLKK